MPEKTREEVSFSARDMYEKGVAALKKNNLDYAVTLFGTALRQEPGFYDAREALRACQHKRAAGKSSFFRKLVGSASSLTRGQMALRSNPLDALPIAEEALNEDAGNIAAHELLAQAALAADLPKTALLSLEVAFKHKPTDKGLALNLAEAAKRVGNRSRAEKIYRDLLRIEPTNPDLNERLKNVLAERTLKEGYAGVEGGQGTFRDALRDGEQARVLEQEQRAVKSEDVVQRLIHEYEARLATDPNPARLMRELADLHLKAKDFDRATGYLERILSESGVADPLLLQTLRDAKIAKFDHLQQSLDREDPGYEAKLASLKADRAAWRLDEARRRAESNPTDLSIRYELGELYLQAGRVGEAIAELQKAQNNPNRRIAAMNLLAQAFSARGMNDLAARKLEEAIKEKPVFDDEAKDLRYQLGLVLEKLGRQDGAIAQFKMIYEQDIGYRDVMQRVDAYYASEAPKA